VKVPSHTSADSAALVVAPHRARFDRLVYVGVMPVLRGADTALSVAVFRAIHLHRGWSRPPAVR